MTTNYTPNMLDENEAERRNFKERESHPAYVRTKEQRSDWASFRQPTQPIEHKVSRSRRAIRISLSDLKSDKE